MFDQIIDQVSRAELVCLADKIEVCVRGQASANLDIVRQTYELGSRNLIDYLIEQRRYVDIENEYIDSQLAVYEGRVEILRATNSPELIKK